MQREITTETWRCLKITVRFPVGRPPLQTPRGAQTPVNKGNGGVAYQLVVTFSHITFGRTARVLPVLTGPLHRQRAVAAEGVDQAGCDGAEAG